MSQKLTAGLPEALDLSDQWVIRFTALDPTTGALVSGVNVSGASLLVDNLGGGDLSAPGFEVVDLSWLNLPIESAAGP